MAGMPGRSGGNLAKPAWLKIAEGNPSKQPLSKLHNYMPAQGDLPPPPAHLTKAQRDKWVEIEASLPSGVLVRADAMTVERCAVAWATFQEATDYINRTGLVVKSTLGVPIRNPFLIVRQQAAKELTLTGMELGLSPLSRTRIGNNLSPERDPMELLLQGAEVWATMDEPPDEEDRDDADSE